MNLLDSILSLRNSRQAGSLASELTQRACGGVWDSVQPRVLAMTAAEASGYIRAKATAAVAARLTVQMLTDRGMSPACRPQVLAVATDGVVEKLLGEVLRIQRQRGLRKAA